MTAVTERLHDAASDADGLARARRGDPDAFVALVRRHDEGLRALAYRLLGDRDAMDDALQEAYVRAFRSLPRFRGESSPATWLYRIVYNACLDELARARRAGRNVAAEAPEGLRAVSPDVDASVQLRSGLESALASLTPEERAAVLLVDALGFDYGDAARVLDVPEGTVASRLHRARAALRRALSEQGGRP